MDKPSVERTEILLRHQRRLIYVVLGVTIPIVAFAGLEFWDPEWQVARLVHFRLALVGMSVVLLFLGIVWLHISLKGNRLRGSDPEIQAITKDEFRRHNWERSTRVAYLVVMAIQLPLAWLLSLRPNANAVWAMACLTTFSGGLTGMVTFLFLNRD